MQREIKFRAWEAEEQVMYYDVGVYKNRITARTNESLLLSRHDYPLMQFTGLKDKNGKEIYEGDLVKYSIQGDVQDNPIEADMVNLHLGMADSDAYMRINSGSLEVIGNIYEHADLLK